MATTLPASKLVNINLSLQAQSVSRLAFGIPFIWDVANTAGASADGQVQSFSTLAELKTAGFDTWDPTYRMAASVFAQKPRVQVLQVGSIDQGSLTVEECFDLFTTLSAVGFYGILIADAVRDLQTIKDVSAWVQLQDNTKFLFAGVRQTDAFELGEYLYNLQSVQTSCWVTDEQPQVQTITISTSFVSGASVTMKVNGVSIGPVAWTPSNTSNTAMLTALASALQATDAIATATSDGSHTITCTAASPLVDLVFSDYAGGGSSPTTARYAVVTPSSGPVDAAALGRIVPLGAGEATLGEKVLIGIEPLSGLTTTVANQAEALRLNYYSRIGGRPMTYPGTCSADIADGVPLFADLVFGAAAFKADLLAGWLDFLMASKKVPYNDSGIAGAVAVLAGIAKNYVGKQYLEPFDQKEAITYPLASEVPAGDKSLRILNGISANFQATGAIQSLGAVNITINA